MKIKRLYDESVCKIHSYYFEDKIAEYITFPKLERTNLVNHLFSTRLGGVSEGYFSEMNLGFSRGDNPGNIIENHRRIATILGCDVEDIVRSDQTHTTNVKTVTEQDKGKGLTKDRDYNDIDGLITNIPGIVLSTSFADCVPLFIVDPVNKAIGLSHSGWRGTVKRMGKATLDAMNKEYGTRAEDVVVAIGPSICQRCYEVSFDVAKAFWDEFGDLGDELLYKKENEKYQLNLHYANKYIFLEAGVKEDNIDITDLCTACNPEYLFSHRKTEGKRGNLGAFMVLK